MSSIAMYAGTFDPITYGHIDVIERASKMFEKIIVAVAASSHKKTLFSLEERLNLCVTVLQHLPSIKVKSFNNLLVDFAKENEAHILIRGLRGVLDFDYEYHLASMNRQLSSMLESVFLLPAENYRYISSTLVREVAGLQGELNHFVPSTVARALEKKYSR